MRKIRAAVIQTVSGTNPAANTAAMRRLVRQAAEQGADWALLPEYWPLMGQNDRDKLALAEPFGSGTLQQAMAETAAECGVTLFGGTIPLQSPVPGKVWNSLLTYDKNGECIGRYDKMHLFGYSGLGERYAEADTIAAGREVPRLTADGCASPNFSAPKARLTRFCCPPPSPTPPARRIGNCCCAPARWKTNATFWRPDRAACTKTAAAPSATA